MLSLTVGGSEYFDREKQEFLTVKPYELRLEHSLLSVSKWESIWKLPFLYMVDDQGRDTKTREQTISYIKCMTLNQNTPDEVYNLIGQKEINYVYEYIGSDMTATWFSEPPQPSKKDSTKLTSELIYYIMIVHQIPWDAQKWHLSRLLTLIRVCDIKSKKEKKMSKTEVMERNRRLNEARKQAANTKG